MDQMPRTAVSASDAVTEVPVNGATTSDAGQSEIEEQSVAIYVKPRQAKNWEAIYKRDSGFLVHLEFVIYF